MNHDQIKERIYSFHDAELSPAEKSEISIHLNSCGECRALLKDWEQVRLPLSSLASPAASNHFVTSVMNRIEVLEESSAVASQKAWRLPDWLFPAMGYGAALALMFFAVNVNQPTFAATTESVLLSDVPDSTQWAFSNATNQSAPLLGADEETL